MAVTEVWGDETHTGPRWCARAMRSEPSLERPTGAMPSTRRSMLHIVLVTGSGLMLHSVLGDLGKAAATLEAIALGELEPYAVWVSRSGAPPGGHKEQWVQAHTDTTNVVTTLVTNTTLVTT